MPRPRLLVDTGPLIALINRRDRFNEPVVQFFRSYFGELLTTWPVLTEATHQVPEHLVLPLLKLLRGDRIQIIELAGALPRMEELMRRYVDRPMDLADASLVWLAEQTGETGILTLDRADFSTYRLKTGKRFEIFP